MSVRPETASSLFGSPSPSPTPSRNNEPLQVLAQILDRIAVRADEPGERLPDSRVGVRQPVDDELEHLGQLHTVFERETDVGHRSTLPHRTASPLA
jgi:hypothetical protein